MPKQHYHGRILGVILHRWPILRLREFEKASLMGNEAVSEAECVREAGLRQGQY